MAPDPDRVPAWQRVAGSWWALALVVGVVFLASPVRSATEHDPAFVPMTAYGLVHHGSLALDEFGARRLVGHPIVVTDGSLDPGEVVAGVRSPGWTQLRDAVAAPHVEVVDYFPWTTALLAVPGVVVTDALAAATGSRDSAALMRDGDFQFVHTASASVVVLLAVLVLRSIALSVLTGTERRRRLLANVSALVVALGTSAWSTASRALWQHTPSLLLLSVALWFAVRIDRTDGSATASSGPTAEDDPGLPGPEARSPTLLDARVLGLGAAAAAATIVRPTNLGFAVLILGWVVIRRRTFLARTILSVVTGALAVVAVFVVANVVLLGQVVPAYYSAGRLVFGPWFGEAVAANWVSPSRGLLAASPILVLAVPGAVLAWRDATRRSLVVALGLSVLAVTVSVSAFPHWWAGHSFGPRFMVEAVPQMFVLALPAVDALLDPVRLRTGAPHRGRAWAVVAVVGVLACWSVLFHASGSVAGVTGCWNVAPVDVDHDPARVWSVLDSQVVEPLHRVLDPRRRAAEDSACLS